MIEEIKNTDNNESGENKILAAIGYIGVLCFVPLFLKKDSDFVQFHAKQGLILFIAWVITWAVGLFPVIGWVAAPVACISLIILSLLGFVYALSGKYWRIPYVSQYAEKIKI